MTVDLTAPAEDLGTRLIIERTTDPATRAQVATNPGVLAIAERADELTDDQRRRIATACRINFATYRVTLTAIRHRVRHAGGPDNLTTRAVDERLCDLFRSPGGDLWFAHAVVDAVYAHLATDYLTSDEIRLFNGPWIDVADPTRR